MSDMTDEAELAKQIEICEFFPAKLQHARFSEGGRPKGPAAACAQPVLGRCDIDVAAFLKLQSDFPARARKGLPLLLLWHGDVESPCRGVHVVVQCPALLRGVNGAFLSAVQRSLL